MRNVVAAALVCALMVSCSSTPVEQEGSSGLPRDLSSKADRGARKVTPKRPREEPKKASSGGGRTQAPVGFAAIGGLEDPADASVGYADVISATLQSDGTDLQVILDMAGGVPDHAPGEGEVVGIAVDLATDKGSYQLFASGENDGWFGYFDTPKGMKPYPGSFQIAGSQIAFTVPWSAFGGPRRGKFSVYCEWSSAEGYTEDLAPDDRSKVPFG